MTRDKLRSRFADDTIVEVKRLALQQLEEAGPDAISLNAIARTLEVSGPALYRYVRSRDELLTLLVLDAYGDLGRALGAAVRGRRTARTAVTSVAAAYRAWAVAEPHRYRLLFRPPLPTYDAHSPDLVQAAQRLMDVVVGALDGASAPPRRPALDAEVADWLEQRGRDRRYAREGRLGIQLWSRLHGLVALEIDGNFASMGIDPGPLYDLEISSLLSPYPDAAIPRPRSSGDRAPLS